MWKTTYRIKIVIIFRMKRITGLGATKIKQNSSLNTYPQHFNRIIWYLIIDHSLSYKTEILFDRITSKKITKEIRMNINAKKAPGIDDIPSVLLKQLSPKAIIILYRILSVPCCLYLSLKKKIVFYFRWLSYSHVESAK